MTSDNRSARTGAAGEQVVPARLFCDATPGVGVEGELVIGASTVVFEAGDAITELPVAGLEARVAGFDDRMLFLSHPSQPGVEVATDDPAAIGAPTIAALPTLAASRRSHRASRRRFWGCVVGVAVLALVATVAVVLGLRLGFGWLSDAWSRVGG